MPAGLLPGMGASSTVRSSGLEIGILQKPMEIDDGTETTQAPYKMKDTIILNQWILKRMTPVFRFVMSAIGWVPRMVAGRIQEQ